MSTGCEPTSVVPMPFNVPNETATSTASFTACLPSCQTDWAESRRLMPLAGLRRSHFGAAPCKETASPVCAMLAATPTTAKIPTTGRISARASSRPESNTFMAPGMVGLVMTSAPWVMSAVSLPSAARNKVGTTRDPVSMISHAETSGERATCPLRRASRLRFGVGFSVLSSFLPTGQWPRMMAVMSWATRERMLPM